MLDYIFIGLICSVIITIYNLLSNGRFTEEDNGEILFWLGACIAWLINALIWPVGLASLVYRLIFSE